MSNMFMYGNSFFAENLRVNLRVKNIQKHKKYLITGILFRSGRTELWSWLGSRFNIELGKNLGHMHGSRLGIELDKDFGSRLVNRTWHRAWFKTYLWIELDKDFGSRRGIEFDKELGVGQLHTAVDIKLGSKLGKVLGRELCTVNIVSDLVPKWE